MTNADCGKEIRRRIAMGRSTMTNLSKIIKDKDISVATKTKQVYSFVFPVVTYGSESWTLHMADRRSLKAFEMWRWMLRISWGAKKTNEWVIEQVQPHMSLLNIIERGKLKYCGHILRSDNSMEKMIMQGKVERKRKGRPKSRWLDEVMEKLGIDLKSTLKLPKNRDEWRKVVHEVTRSRHNSTDE